MHLILLAEVPPICRCVKVYVIPTCNLLQVSLRVSCFCWSTAAKGGISKFILVMQVTSLIWVRISGSKFTNSSPVSGDLTSKDACRPTWTSSIWFEGIQVNWLVQQWLWECGKQNGKIKPNMIRTFSIPFNSSTMFYCSLYLFRPVVMVKNFILQQDPWNPVIVLDDTLGLWCTEHSRMLHVNKWFFTVFYCLKESTPTILVEISEMKSNQTAF